MPSRTGTEVAVRSSRGEDGGNHCRPRRQGMRHWATCVVVGVVMSAGIPIGLVPRPLQAQQNVLVSKKVTAPPPMEPEVGDAWKVAQPLTVKAIGGKNF